MNTYAYCAEYSRRFGVPFFAPSDWEGTVLFKNQVHRVIEEDQLRLELNQTQTPCDSREYRLAAVARYDRRAGDDLAFMDADTPDSYGCLNGAIDSVCYDNPWAWRDWSRVRLLNHVFQFSEEVKNSDFYKRLEDRQGTYDIAHIRRDDIADIRLNKSGQNAYPVLSMNSYFKAFGKFGYDWRTMEYTTDDRTGKWIKGVEFRDAGWVYPTGSVRQDGIFFDWFPDFLRLVFARTIFRANSSFSWWASCLSNARIFSPILQTRTLYLEPGDEVEVDFVEGNHPHWLLLQNEGYSKGEILVGD